MIEPFAELPLKRVHMRSERRDPIGRKGLADKFKFLRPQMRRGEINFGFAGHKF